MLSADFNAGTHSSAPIIGTPVSPTGKTVSYWNIGEQLTGGRWNQMFRATPKSLAGESGYDYVLKLVNPFLKGDKKRLATERLGREAAASESVNHQCVIPLLDAELDQAPFFLVQPWIAGGSLDKFLSIAPNVSLIRCLWIFRQVTEAIASAHDKGRAFLGLDPSHVLLGSGGRVLLIGWSQSHVAGQPLTIPHDRLQLVTYTAPECFDAGQTAKLASDVYSLGLFIHRLLSGATPISGSSIAQVIQQHQERTPVELIRTQPVCPPRLSQLVSQMVAKDVNSRPSIREVLNELIAIEIEHLGNPAIITL